MKKKLCAFFLLTLLMLSSFIAVSAHSGRTDGAGGHYDSSTGEYHYHHGYPAHQHKNGVCPYDYDDNTDHSNGTSKETSQGTSKSTPNKLPWFVWVIVSVVCVAFFITDIVLEGKITTFFISILAGIFSVPIYILGLVAWIIDKVRKNK